MWSSCACDRDYAKIKVHSSQNQLLMYLKVKNDGGRDGK